MAKAKSYLPEGLRQITAHLVVKNALETIEFYKKAFGAEVLSHAPGPTPGSTMHAAIRIGDSTVFMADETTMSTIKAPSNLGGTTSSLMLFVPDCDAVFNKAVAAGAKVNMPIADQFWGDRYGQLMDPAGHVWEIGTHKEDLTPEEIGKRAQAAMAEFAKQK
jgi:PhnB protein